MEYLNKFHKEATEKCLKELEEQKKLKLNSNEEAKKHFEMHARIAKNYATEKPDWITDEQWELNPNIYHWEQSRKAMEFVKQSKPVTHEQAVAQAKRLKANRGTSQNDNDTSIQLPKQKEYSHTEGEESNLIDDRSLIPEYIRHEQPSKD